ncbi:MAG: hypothetical protein U5K76_15285 [Woeseiaceae bacterium]|nr:hypothetical protein [Woeseiaceae bacterium]
MFALFRTPFTTLSRISAGGLLAALLALAGTGAVAQVQQPEPPAPAQPQPGTPMSPQGPSQQVMQQIVAKRAEIQQLGTELKSIQEATMEANPELAAQREELVTLVDTKLVEAGHDPAASRDKIEDLQGQLQGGELSQDKQQAVSQELRSEVNTLQQAQNQVMQDEEVRSKQQSLNDDLLKAMEEQNPKTEELIADLRQAQQQYQQLANRARQQRSGGMSPQGN